MFKKGVILLSAILILNLCIGVTNLISTQVKSNLINREVICEVIPGPWSINV